MSPPPNWPAAGRACTLHRFALRRDRVRAAGPRAWEPYGLIGHPFLLDCGFRTIVISDFGIVITGFGIVIRGRYGIVIKDSGIVITRFGNVITA